MNTIRRELQMETIVDNTHDWSLITKPPKKTLPRDGGVEILKEDDQFAVLPYGNLFQPPKTWFTKFPFNRFELFRYVEECRQVWQKEIVDAYKERNKPEGGNKKYYFFQQKLDFSDELDELKKRVGKLAVAGEKLFFLLFEDPSHPAKLLDIGSVLREESRAKPLTLTITSDCFFVPWGMLYVHPDPKTKLEPDGANFDWKGFWGYRHIIEHNTEDLGLENELRIDKSGKLKFSVNVDENIDTSLNISCVQSLVAFFKNHLLLDALVRTRSNQLRDDLMDIDFADRIVFFCCHGRGSRYKDGINLEPSAIQLTDAMEIKDSDLKFWLGKKNGKNALLTHPFVFINACQGGQMTTLFYQTLAAEFLKQKAVGLVGSQIDIPALFAREYAKQFFSKLLNPADGPVHVGPLMRDLTQEFVSKYHNPLGLAYSLYRGLDCFVESI